MFSCWLRLNTKNAIGTKKTGKRKGSLGFMLLLKTRKRAVSVPRKHARVKYISATLLYLVMVPNPSMMIRGKSILC